MTALDSLSSVEGFADLDGGRQVELIVYALTEIGGSTGVKPAQVLSAFETLHLSPYSRIQQYLWEKSQRKRGKPPPTFLKGPSGYRLEARARADVSSLFLGRPVKIQISKHLSDLVPVLKSEDGKSYLNEALGCFTHGFFRAAVVMTWCLTFDLLRDWVFTQHLPALNAKFAARPKNPFTVANLSDFESVGERDLLDTMKAAGILSREQYKTLVQLLDDRNSYAHPSGKAITPSIAEAYIEKAVLQAIAELK